MTDQEMLHLFNPLPTDFEYDWYDEQDKAHTLVLRSHVLTALPPTQGRFMAKHLADAICIAKGIKNNTDEWNKVLNEVMVNDLD